MEVDPATTRTPRQTAPPGTLAPSGEPTGGLGGRCVGNSYVLIEPIGQGATGTVWRALDRSSGEQVAVKLLRAELMKHLRAVTRFVQERAILLMLRHSNIVRVRDLLTVNESLGLVMDLVDGGSLREHVQRQPTMPAGDAAAFAAQVADALAAAHALGVVHRDLKPDNIMLDQTDGGLTPRLTDFGIARVLDAPGLTTVEALVGTPNYMAPELIEGARPTPAADVYALGILFYELIVGRQPYAGGSPVAVLRRHLDAQPHRPPGVADASWDLIQQCLDKDPDRRPSAKDLVPVLRALAVRTADMPALPPPPPEDDDLATDLADPLRTARIGHPHSPGRQTGEVTVDVSLSGLAAWRQRLRTVRDDLRQALRPAAGRRRAGQFSQRNKLLRRFATALALIAGVALVAGITGTGWRLLDRGTNDKPAAHAAPTAAVAIDETATARPRPEPGVILAKPSPSLPPPTFGPQQCAGGFTFDKAKVGGKPCYATSTAMIRLSGTMRVPPGLVRTEPIVIDVEIMLRDAEGAKQIVAGPYPCRDLTFNIDIIEHTCGPIDAKPPRGHSYVIRLRWSYWQKGPRQGQVDSAIFGW